MTSELSERNRLFRLACLGKAFGLSVHYLQRFIDGQASMGGYLLQEVAKWCDDHPNLNPNNRLFDVTFFADINVDGA